jgi:steroid delta-isomerase-like uncharacterized protein
MTTTEAVTSTDVARANIEAFNTGDWKALAATFAETCVYEEFATHRHLEGQEAIVEANRGWKEAFPDAAGKIERTMADNGTVTLELTWQGTQSGPLHMPGGDIPASNHRIDLKAAQVFEIEGERIREARHYYDLTTLLRQIGAVA